MNYVFKLHPSSGLLAESLVNNAKYSRESYVCGHCLRRHKIIQNNAQELSTYVSALKLMLKKKEILKKAENKEKLNINPSKKKNTASKTELLKVTSNRSLSTKMTIQQIKPSEITAFAVQPGLTFSKFKALKAYKAKILTSSLSKENLLKHYLKNNVEVKPKQSSQKKTPKKITKISDNLSSDLIIESKLNMLELGSKTNIQPAKKFKNKSVDNAKKDSTFAAVKVLPLSTVEIIPAVKKQNNSIKSELKQLVLPKPEQTIPKPQPNTDILDLLKPPDHTINSDNAKSSYFMERELLPFCLTGSQNYSFFQLIHSYIDVCIMSDNLREALKMVYNCRSRSTWKSVLKENKNMVVIYNTLLKPYAEMGNWNVVQIIAKWMDEDKVKLNSESFAHVLFCLGNSNAKELQDEEQKKTEIIKIIHKLISNNVSINDVFAKTKLPKEKTDLILSLFRKVLPSFEIEPTLVKLNSECQLLKNLHAGPNILQAHLNELSHETMEKLVEEQMMMEKNYFIRVKAVSKQTCSEKQIKEVEALKNEWRNQIRRGFVKKLKLSRKAEAQKKYNIFMYLNSLPVESFVNIMMQLVEELVEYSGSYSPGVQVFYKTLGEKVFQCYQVQKKLNNGDLKRTEDLFKKYSGWYLDPTGPARNTRQEWQMLSQDSNGRCQLDTTVVKWPLEVLDKVGRFLYDVILTEVKFSQKRKTDSVVPVFYSILRNKGNRNLEEIKCHPSVAYLFRSVGFNNLSFPADEVPMVCPPKPWKASDHGGYLILPTDFVRSSEQCSGKVINFNRVAVQKLYATFDALNALQAVPWIVNQDVLDIALEVFRNGGSESLSVPGFPDMTPAPRNVTHEMSPSERFEQYKKAREIVMNKRNEYGLWCEALYKLSLANHFRKKVFWLPQNCDFRGRVYPVPPHLSHLGADLFRSLLIFAKAKPLGSKGLDWLKIHTINLTGTHKKKCVEERLDHANTILPKILDSAEKPLTGDKWWMESEEPWQTLAACKEIKKALSSPNPEMYVSGFPVHQDGSCNGLQHYAALGRDIIGARSVNLTPCGTPQDVYSVVAEIIEEKRKEEARNGSEIAQILEGFIERKIVKQTVMTTVYGVTKYGAKLQIAKRLEELPSFPKEHIKKSAEYLSVKTFESLNQMFCSAKEIQDWFIQCAHKICKKNDYVQWNTPLGLPVMQSYGKKRRDPKTHEVYIVPDSMKQKNAFPPNFIHSLDSTHMMLTALFCEQAGITFAAIHDCFWTHPGDVDTLNKICREQFISLHSEEILRDLSDFFNERFIKQQTPSPEDESAAKIFSSVPKTGDFSLDQVLNSVYFFS